MNNNTVTPANTPEKKPVRVSFAEQPTFLEGTQCPLKVAKWAHANGIVEKEQVDTMEKFVNGEIDYGTMRSMCG
mgnify:CR=1 FL=1|tara:strand:- start:2101 stop:2322 length:222 start_codon:yes stop_codon:yes gene_type:complete